MSSRSADTVGLRPVFASSFLSTVLMLFLTLISTQVSILVMTASVAHAGPAGDSRTCLGNGQVLPINNSKVLQWKLATPNSWKGRAHVQGTLVQQYDDHNGHEHFEVKIGSGAGENIEVIYNMEFGDLPVLSAGMTIEACGDYITARTPAGPYPASPDGAILHWVHQSNSSHEDGFVVVNGQLCGQDAYHAGPKRYPNYHGR